jgi:cyclophilin family peptidyl-prolyl cis-trans isomerase
MILALATFTWPVVTAQSPPAVTSASRAAPPPSLRLRMLGEEDARSTTPTAILQGLKGEDAELRRVAVRALGRLESPEVAAAILPSLSDREAAVRVEAANALAQSVFATARPADVVEAARNLRARLATEPHPLVRGALALSIGRLRYPSDEAGREAASVVLDVAFPKGANGERAPASPAVLVNALRGLHHSAMARPLPAVFTREPGAPPVTWLSEEARETLVDFVAPRLECLASSPPSDRPAGSSDSGPPPRPSCTALASPLAAARAPAARPPSGRSQAGPRAADAEARFRRQAVQVLAATRTPDPLVGLALLWEPDDQTRALALRWALPATWMDEGARDRLIARWARRFGMAPDAARAEVLARASTAARLARVDPSAMVRYEAVRTLAPEATTRLGCGEVVAAMDDPAVAVAAHAMENAHLACRGDEGARRRLEELTRATPDAAHGAWHRYAAALLGYARVDPSAARSRVVAAMRSASAPVRRAGAAAAGQMPAGAVVGTLDVDAGELAAELSRLVDDEDDNVATQAIRALAERDPTGGRDALLRALRRDGYESVLEAARALRRVAADGPEPDRALPSPGARAPAPAAPAGSTATQAPPAGATHAGVPATAVAAPDAAVASIALDTLGRITRARRETSRDPRRALVELVGTIGRGEDAIRLEPWLRDFDPVVARAAADAIGAIRARSVATPAPAPAASAAGGPSTAPTPSPQPLPRLALPSDADLARMSTARVVLVVRGRGEMAIRLRPDEAPLNAFRFLRLAEAGYYTGLTFHRIAPNFVVQGGSPGANEHAGDGPFTRDEVGLLSNQRGSVGLSTRGRDTGDAQFYVNLADNVRLDHDYTVFAQVESGMEVVDALVEGDVIERVEIRGQV